MNKTITLTFAVFALPFLVSCSLDDGIEDQSFPVIEELEVINIQWARSFQPGVFFSLKKEGEKTLFMTRVFKGIGFEEVEEESIIELREEIFDEIEDLITSDALISYSKTDRGEGMDGSTWTIEGVKGKFRFSFSAWSPLRKGKEGKNYIHPTGHLCERILELTDIDFPDNEKF